MTEALRVILEIGRKRRVAAAAYEWPGLDRWGTSEDDALAKLESYLPRYAPVAQRASLAKEFSGSTSLEVDYNDEGRPARTWPIQFLIRRTAQHAMDHAWEMEDRDLTGS